MRISANFSSLSILVRIFSYFSCYSLICYILVVKDLVGLYHDTGDIAGEKVVVISNAYFPLIDCAETTNGTTCGSRAWPMLHKDALRRSCVRLLLLSRLHLIELTFWDDD